MDARVFGRLGVADVVSASNAALGFLAVVVATSNLELSARLVLLAAVLDGLDGVLARRYGGTDAGQYLDSLADVASFGVAPAMLVAMAATARWPLEEGGVLAYAGVLVPTAFVAVAVIRLALYTAYDTGGATTEGIPSTLAATIVGAATLAAAIDAPLMVGALAVFSVWMIAPITYPDLLARDALIMGVVHSLAVLFPMYLDRTFPWALLFLALAYLLFSPKFYWRDVSNETTTT